MILWGTTENSLQLGRATTATVTIDEPPMTTMSAYFVSNLLMNQVFPDVFPDAAGMFLLLYIILILFSRST